MMNVNRIVEPKITPKSTAGFGSAAIASSSPTPLSLKTSSMIGNPPRNAANVRPRTVIVTFSEFRPA